MAISQLNLSLFRRYRFACICGVVALLVGGLYGYLSSMLDEKKAVLTQMRSEEESIQRNMRNSVGLPEQLPVLRTGLLSLEERLMRTGDVAAYQSFFFKLETDSAVKIARLLPTGGARAGQPKPAGSYRPMGFEVAVDGTFADVVGFMRNIESAPRYYRLLSFSLRPGAAQSASNPVVLAMSLELLGSQ